MWWDSYEGEHLASVLVAILPLITYTIGWPLMLLVAFHNASRCCMLSGLGRVALITGSICFTMMAFGTCLGLSTRDLRSSGVFQMQSGGAQCLVQVLVAFYYHLPQVRHRRNQSTSNDYIHVPHRVELKCACRSFYSINSFKHRQL